MRLLPTSLAAALFVLFLGGKTALFAQNTAAGPALTPEEAVQIALANNFDIRLAQADADIAKTNNTRANAGQLPTVNLVANETFTVNAFQQKLANGSEFTTPGAPFNVANAGVVLNWPLFDGRRMYIAKDRLEAQEKLGQLNLQNQVQQTAAAVLLAYCEVARSQTQERALQEVIALNEERLRIANARLAAGFAAQTDALSAELDLNQRRSDLLLQQNVTVTARRTLNRLMARDVNTAFSVVENAVGTTLPDRATLVQQLSSQNASLLALQQNVEVTHLVTDETRTLNKPRLTGISQFNAQRTDNGAGFLLNNSQAGVSVGASFTMPLYSGGNVGRQVQVAELANKQAQLRVDAQRQTLEADLDNLLSYAQVQQQVLVLENKNVETARQNLNISTERFRLGQTNGLEPQTAQNTLEQALLRRNLADFNLQTASVRLRLIAGSL